MLRTLLNFWLYPVLGMMFAAGAGVLDGVGGGDGASGGGDSGASRGDASGEVSSEGDGGDADGQHESGEPQLSDGPSEGESEGSADRTLGDGKKIPAKYAELFKTDKTLREMYFNQLSLRKTFPGGVKEAVELKKAVESFGGVDAVEQLQSEIGSLKGDRELFSKADPKWVESGFAENPESALKLFAHTLSFVGENHPEHYDHLMAKVIVQDIASSPLSQIQNYLLGKKDDPAAQELAKQLYAYYAKREKLAKNVPEKQIDPQQKKLDAQAADLTKKEQEIRNKTINTEAAPYMQRQIEGSLAKAAKAAGFDLAKLQKEQPNRYGRFLKDVRAAIHANVLGDRKWLDRYSAALATGDTAKCVRMLNARHDQAIHGAGGTPGVVAPVFHEWFGPPKAAARPQNQNQNRGNANNANRGTSGAGRETPVVVNALPAPKDINYSDPVTDRWAGIYRLKTGKLIQVKR